MISSSNTPPVTLSTDDACSSKINLFAKFSRSLETLRPSWFREPPLLGIDIGTAAIKLVELRRNQGSISLGKIAITQTPGEALSGGALTNSIAAAGALRGVLRAQHVRCRRAALAVGGAKARAQCEAVPAESFESEEALWAFVERTVWSQIETDVDFAALDYQTVASSGGGAGAVMWAGSGGAEVDWARQAAVLAGRIPVLIEPRACSLANVYLFNHQPEDGRASLLLHTGARWMTLALVRDGLLLYSRDVPLAQDGGTQGSPNAPVILGALRPYLHELAGRAAPAKIDNLVMSGTARADQCGEGIHRDTGLMVQQMEPFRRIKDAADSPDGALVREWGPLFSVAVGLALRRFEDL